MGRQSYGKGSSSLNRDAGKGQGSEPQPGSKCLGKEAASSIQGFEKEFQKFLAWPLFS